MGAKASLETIEKMRKISLDIQNRIEMKEHNRKMHLKENLSLETLNKMKISHNSPEVIQKKKDANRIKMKSVKRIDPIAEDVKEYESIHSVTVDGFKYQEVWACCNNRQGKHRGFYWQYANIKERINYDSRNNFL